MRRLFAAALLAVALCLPALAQEARYEPRLDKDGYEVLFDGKDLNGWQMERQKDIWVIDDQGLLTPHKGGGTLFTKVRYCDYELLVDFKVAANQKSNSGVFLRVHDMRQEVNTGLEIQILDNAAYGAKWDAMNAQGALYGLVHPAVDANAPLGDWNHYKITANGPNITVVLNDKEIVKADLSLWTKKGLNPDGQHNKFAYPIAALPREGFIGLQNYGGKAVWFKNVRLKKLSDRAPKFTGKEPIGEVLTKLD